MHRGLFGTWLPRHSSGILQIAADALQSRIQRDRDPLGQGLHLHLRLYGTSHSTTFCHSRLPPGYTRSLKIRHLESQGICLGIASGNYTIFDCTQWILRLGICLKFRAKISIWEVLAPKFPKCWFWREISNIHQVSKSGSWKARASVLGLLQAGS